MSERSPRTDLGILRRYVYDNGRIVPRNGDLARMLEDVTLEGGAKLRADQNVKVEHVLEEFPEVVGIKWRDKHGTHVMAMDVDKIEVVLRDQVCPNCGSAWMEGTGLFVCGEGVNGNVHGGCRVYYTAALIRELRTALEGRRIPTGDGSAQ